MDVETASITITLIPWPARSPRAYRATMACAHGTSEHVVISKPELVAQGVPGFQMAHTDETGCRCSVGEITVEDVTS